MKSLLIAFALMLHAAALQAAEPFPTSTLETENYVVEITFGCPEGHVTCDRITYKGVSKKTGKALTLRGKTVHTTCADGVTPCRFVGYAFQNGKHNYFVSEDLDGLNGVLSVRAQGKEILLERGKWK